MQTSQRAHRISFESLQRRWVIALAPVREALARRAIAQWKPLSILAIAAGSGPIAAAAIVDSARYGPPTLAAAALAAAGLAEVWCRGALAGGAAPVAAPFEVEGSASDRLVALDRRVAAYFAGLEAGRLAFELPVAAALFVALCLCGGPIALGVLLLYSAARLAFGAAAPAVADYQRRAALRRDDFVDECAAALPLVRSAGMEPFLHRRFEQLAGATQSAANAEGSRKRSAIPIATLAGCAVVATAALTAGPGGALSAGVAAALCTARLSPFVDRLSRLVAGRQLFEPARSEPSKPRLPKLAAVLDGAAGKIVAICAADGDRASAVLRALAAESGAILVGPRAPMLAGTVLDNLTGFGATSPREALLACDLLALRSGIDQLPQGLHTLVGPDAIEPLPPALEHRLAIARAIAARPQLLLLDEPQALLDAKADAELTAALRELRGVMTIVIATSRPSYLALADRRISLDAEDGAPEMRA